MKVWKKFYDAATPEYLARYYWWAYLWKVGVWFFDHQWIINLILFGKYKTLVHTCLQTMERQEPGRVLQLSCVYGNLSKHLYAMLRQDLHVVDIAPVQLTTTRAKLPASKQRYFLERMNAEGLGFRNQCFDTVLIFFLLHEMPPLARERVLHEAIRVLEKQGRLLIVEYGELGQRHWMHRWALTRALLGRLEPFLPGFWRESLQDKLAQAATNQKRSIASISTTSLFDGFYRVVEIRLKV